MIYYYILLGRILQLPRGKGHKRTSRSYSKVPHLTHPPIRIRKAATAAGSPYSFRIVREFFYVPQNYQHSRNCETGPPTYRPYPRSDAEDFSDFKTRGKCFQTKYSNIKSQIKTYTNSKNFNLTC